jgi:DNA-binding transcriptional regulator/RsmH inhibitor MraZ
LRAYANLTGEVVVAGVHSRIELWDKVTWDAEQSDADDQSATLAEQLGTLALPATLPAGLGI